MTWSLRLFVLALACFLTVSLRPSLAQVLAPEEKQAIEQLIKDYILNHPQIVAQALETERNRQAAAAEAAINATLASRHDQLLADPTSPIGGNPQGAVAIVEFFDYRCPYCKSLEPQLEALIKNNRDLQIIYKEFPILGPTSVTAARVALAAHLQGKYDAFHRAMMNTKGNFTDEVVFDTAQGTGVDLNKLKIDMRASGITDAIENNLQLAAALHIGATPAFVIGNSILRGTPDIQTLQSLINGYHG